MIHMPLLAESSDASIENGSVAMSAFRAIEILIASFAMRGAIMLIEIGGSKRSSTVAAREMLGVKGLAQCLDDLAENRALACPTIASRCGIFRVDIVHLRREILEQTVEIVALLGRGSLGDGSRLNGIGSRLRLR